MKAQLDDGEIEGKVRERIEERVELTASTTPLALTSISLNPLTAESTVNIIALQPRSVTFLMRRSEAFRSLFR
jgi:hypothetical protein